MLGHAADPDTYRAAVDYTLPLTMAAVAGITGIIGKYSFSWLRNKWQDRKWKNVIAKIEPMAKQAVQNNDMKTKQEIKDAFDAAMDGDTTELINLLRNK